MIFAVAEPGISKPGVRPRRGRILGVSELFWCPFTLTLWYCSKSSDNITYCKHCMLTSIKVYAYYTVNIYNNTQKDTSNGDTRTYCACPGSAFALSTFGSWNRNALSLMLCDWTPVQSLRRFNHVTKSLPQCISSRGKDTNITIFLRWRIKMCLIVVFIIFVIITLQNEYFLS